MSTARSIFLIALLAARFSQAAQNELPPKLIPWADAAYPERLFLMVEAPGEAGNVDLHRETTAAGIRLPLRMVPPPGGQLGSMVPEQILLMGEDGVPQSINLHQIAGDSDTEIRFRTQPGLRRFCLYYGAPANGHQRVSPTDFIAADFGLCVRGRVSPPEFQYLADKLLTLERFEDMEKTVANAFPIRFTPNINDAECPLVTVTVDGLGRNPTIFDPDHYVALYEGFLRTPIRGSYTFALDTLGAAHVLIDGSLLLSAAAPDSDRAPFALQKSVDLTEGVHRVVVYYAEANPPGKTNATQQRFGLRLHWKPPWSQGLMCIPAAAFVHSLPVQIMRHELASGPVQGSKDGGGAVMPFIQTEVLGQVRCAAHLGETGVREQALIFARAIDAEKDVAWTLSAGKKVICTEPARAEGLIKWVPAGADINIALEPLEAQKSIGSLAQRTVRVPIDKDGRSGVLDLEGEIELKNAPEFLYPDETAHIHIQTDLCPQPRIIAKERSEAKLLPPPARPIGEFKLLVTRVTLGNATTVAPIENVDVTPAENGRRLHRVSIPGSQLDPLSKDGHTQIVLTLLVGDVECESIKLRLLNAEKDWPGEVLAGPGDLFLSDGAPDELAAPSTPHAPSGWLQDKSGAKVPEWRLERVLMLLSRQNDAEYRNFGPLKSVASGGLGDAALFLGDPLVESLPTTVPEGQVYGIAGTLAKLAPKLKWEQVYVAGPHRNLPVYRMIAELEKYAQNKVRVPALVVLSLGAGDVARQTPLYSFERALDALLERLKEYGAKKIVIVGVVPEVDRAQHAEPYQQKVLDLERQHHLLGVDIFHEWTKENNWTRRYSIDKDQLSVFGPLPNAEALDEIAKMIEEQIR